MLTRLASRCYSSVAVNAGRLNASTSSLLSSRMNKQVEFNWQKYVDEKTPEILISGFKQWDAQLAAARTAAADADKTVEPVDWKFWESEIEDKEALRQVRQEYETMKFPPPEGVDVSELENRIRSKLKLWDNYVVQLKEDLEDYDRQLVIAKEDVLEVPYYTYWDWMRKFPGAQEQFQQEFDEGFITPQQSSWDFYLDNPHGKLRQCFKTGNFKQFTIPPTMPYVYGKFDWVESQNYYLEWERKTFTPFGNYEEIKKILDDQFDMLPAYLKAREEIDEEVANYDGYNPHGGH